MRGEQNGQKNANSDAGEARLEHSGQPENDENTESLEEAGQVQAESRQRKLRLILRQCDRVLLMDFDLLAMNDWPR